MRCTHQHCCSSLVYYFLCSVPLHKQYEEEKWFDPWHIYRKRKREKKRKDVQILIYNFSISNIIINCSVWRNVYPVIHFLYDLHSSGNQFFIYLIHNTYTHWIGYVLYLDHVFKTAFLVLLLILAVLCASTYVHEWWKNLILRIFWWTREIWVYSSDGVPLVPFKTMFRLRCVNISDLVLIPLKSIVWVKRVTKHLKVYKLFPISPSTLDPDRL